MNDLQLPPLRATAPTQASSPADAVGGGTRSPDNGFDQVLARSRAPAARTEDGPRNDAQRADHRRAQTARGPAPADAHAPSRVAARDTRDSRRGDGESGSTAAAAAQDGAAADVAGTDRDAAAAEAAPEAGAKSPSAAVPAQAATGDAAATAPILDLAAQTAALVAAAAALSAASRTAAAPTSAPAAGELSTAAGELSSAAGEMAAAALAPEADTSPAAQAAAPRLAAAGVPAKAVVTDSARADGSDLADLADGRGFAAVKDRLAEDFERRFETSLARTVGAAPGNAGPLAAAGLPALAPAPAAMHSMAHASVASPLGHPSFADDLSYRVLMFAGQRVQNAELSVTPADLGPINVSIEVRGQEASLVFGASHATTRAAIEDALPRLREMLAAQGLQLAQANVGDAPHRGRGDASADRGRGTGSGAADGARATQAAGSAGAAGIVRRIGLIDVHV